MAKKILKLKDLQPESYFLTVRGRPGHYLHPGPDTADGDRTYLIRPGKVGAAVWTAENVVLMAAATGRQDFVPEKVTDVLK